MENKVNRIVKLVTAQRKRQGTMQETSYFLIFADQNTQGLVDVEKNVFDMIQDTPDCWSCGCVTGYPHSMFNPTDLEQLRHHGIGKRFTR